MVEVLRSSQAADKVVSITTIVRGALDLSQMGSLVDDGVALGLGVAARAAEGHRVEKVRAVGHVAGAGQGVGDDAVGAGAVDVAAVQALSRRAGAAGAGDAREDGRHGALGRGRSRLEEVGHARVVAVGGRLGGAGEGAAHGQRVLHGGEARAGAVGLHGEALVDERAADGGGLGTVDGCDRGVGSEGDGTRDGGRVSLGGGEGTSRDEVKVTADGEVVELSNIEGDFDRGASGDGAEGILVEALGGDEQAETIKGDLLV